MNLTECARQRKTLNDPMFPVSLRPVFLSVSVVMPLPLIFLQHRTRIKQTLCPLIVIHSSQNTHKQSDREEERGREDTEKINETIIV